MDTLTPEQDMDQNRFMWKWLVGEIMIGLLIWFHQAVLVTK